MLHNYFELISKYDPQSGSIDHTAPHRIDQNHPIPIQTMPSKSKEDPKPLVSVSTTIMIVIHFAKVSAPYPRVVILSLAK
jgi:hypothetical protein